MSSYLLIAISASVLRVIWLILSAAFRCIEKAHEHLRESDRPTGGGELVKGKVS